MLTIRATAKLLKHWKISTLESFTPSISVLGDLYSNAITVGRRRIILGVFERTFLPVVLPLAQLVPMLPALRRAVDDMLHIWKIPREQATPALPDTDNVVVTNTASRVALGVLNDFARLLQSVDPRQDVWDQSIFLGDTPLSPLEMASPKIATHALLSRPRFYIVK